MGDAGCERSVMPHLLPVLRLIRASGEGDPAKETALRGLGGTAELGSRGTVEPPVLGIHVPCGKGEDWGAGLGREEAVS